MIGPNFPPSSNLRHVRTPGDPTLANPGFFDQPIFPTFSSTGLDGLIPIMPMQLTGLPMGGAAPAAEGKKADKGKKAPKVDEKALVKMQKEYMENIYKNFLQSSLELQSSFGMFLGVPPKT
jgi:hypothetical protein